MATRSLEELSKIVARHAATLSSGLRDQMNPSPTIRDIDAPDFRKIDEVAAAELANAARELQTLVQGPGQHLSLLAFAVCGPCQGSLRRTMLMRSHSTTTFLP